MDGKTLGSQDAEKITEADMTPEERAEKIVRKYQGQYSLIAAAAEIAAEIADACRAAVEEAERRFVTNGQYRRRAYKYGKANAYEDAAKIAEQQPCYHNTGACGPYIARDIRARAKELK